LVNWCPTDQTGLSDSEVEHEDVEGELLTFRYPLSDGSGAIACATTRVETMLGDTGIAVHPDDERYASLIGQTVRHPFDGREIPIVADAAIDPAFGTGAVKVTPAHDPVDFDNAHRKPPGDWSRLGMERFNRSLRKVALETGTEFDSAAWAEIVAGYTARDSAS
jgi:valyl-tRNA synthetase